MAIENRIVIGSSAAERIVESSILTSADASGASTTIALTNYSSIAVSNHKIVGSGSTTTNLTWVSTKGTYIGSALANKYYKVSDYKFIKIDHIETNGCIVPWFTMTCANGITSKLVDGNTVYIYDFDAAEGIPYDINTSNFSQARSYMLGEYVSRTGTDGTYSLVTDMTNNPGTYYIKIFGYAEDYAAAKNFDYEFTNATVESITGEFAVGTVGDELATDTLTVNVRSETKITAKYGDLVRYYQDGTLFAKMYIESVERRSADRYTLNCMSVVGLLNNIYHVGAVYSGTTFSTVLTSVLSGVITANADYTVNADVGNIKVYGWLPYDTARNNLHKLLMAYNVSMVKSSSDAGVIEFCFLGQDGTESISNNNIYIDGSATNDKKPTTITVREHSFINGNSESVVLFDNSSSGVNASNQLIIYDTAPIERVECTGSLTAVSSGANYAIVNGIGALIGYPYIHQTYDLTLQTGATDTDNTVSITEDTLISIQNSQAVMDRLESYYMKANVDKLSIAVNGEKCGKRYNFTSTMQQSITNALLSKMSINVSTFTKAECELISNIDFIAGGHLMSYRTTLVGDSSWTVPAWWQPNTPIRVVLIGGGTGGNSGYAGENGEDGNSVTGGNGGKGGNGGQGGTSGRVLNVALKVSPGQVFSCSTGAGGSGGSPSSSTDVSNAGSAGTDTTFGSYSSASGSRVDNGFVDFIYGTRYATQGTSGIKGGSGGKGGDLFLFLDTRDYTVANGEDGESCGTYLGGNGADYDDATYTITRLGTTTTTYTFNYVECANNGYTATIGNCGGGGGSGAVATFNGNDGGVASGNESDINESREASKWTGTIKAGKGGNGRRPTKRSSATVYGSGGDGGHGGSGAGGNGAAKAIIGSFYLSNPWYTGMCGNDLNVDNSSHTVATGGQGGQGGNGASGAILIYSPYGFTTNSYTAVADLSVADRAIVGTL